ncbi:hypothetical protein DPMN_014925 [Dreissena polymorpha]|uniref:MADF domain-containing protein n=1 Tax=Dreissena polymorpha TaxID=45954 RepID=A0A9D4S3Z2_DREPO|nr:hypothetical protein DPMN_014925 [Dreissena polymorpha]
MWKEKATEIRKSVSVLKTWYTSLRRRYGRLKKKQSGNDDTKLTKRDKWVVRHFAFLHPFILEVQKRPIVSVS